MNADSNEDLPISESAQDAVQQPAVQKSMKRPTHVVGIGASAGGLEALELFFNAMPAENGMAFVVVQHLSPDFKSLMDELLSHRTSMAIHRVEDGMRVEPNEIYLIPPKKEMIISGGRLLLTDKDPHQALTLPIDHFLRSLAHDAGRDAIAVVLSGTGSDGSRGIRAIHEAGGLVVVQSQESAKFDGMPKSALDTGVADLVLQPSAMPAALLRYVEHPIAATLDENHEQSPDGENGVLRLFQLLRDQYGIDFAHYKPSTVGRRIERRLLMQKIGSFEEYLERLEREPEELNALYRDLLIGVTKFFRDPEAFRRLGSEVIPELLLQSPANGEFRIWVPGCGTGEEAYSLAILVREALQSSNRPIDVKIFATDVHSTSIEFASAGVYSDESLSELDPARLERYFTRRGDGYQVAQELRQMIVFAQHNIIRDAPFTKMDLISCRNLLIYLQPNAQKKALSLFHFGLRTGGVLFLGPSENLAELGDEFETIDSRWKVYRKRRDIRLPADLRLPPSAASVHLRPDALTPPAQSVRTTDGGLLGTYDLLLNEFMPPALLINERRELVHAFGGAERYLTVKGGRATADILDMVDADLRIPLSGALNRADKDRRETRLRGIRVKGFGPIELGVRSIQNPHADTSHLLITLHEEQGAPPAEVSDKAEQVDVNQESRDRVASLETELQYARENLQATVEELEASNEELQASNEELVASNEELQSTNEELHSVNEELYTVNAEYQRKIGELTQLTNDMDNLLRSTEIGTIFLDRDLCIRKFTPQISRVCNLLPQDVGRRIDAFTHTIDEPQLLERMREVLQTSAIFEREVRDQQGNWYFLRILPYRSSTADVEGIVVTLIDTSALKRAQAEIQTLNRQLTGILDNSTTFIYVKDLEGRFTLCNHVSEQILGALPERVLERTEYDFLPPDVADRLLAHDREVVTTGRAARFEEVIPQKDGEHTYLSVKFPLRDRDSRIYGVGSVCTDITERKHIEEQQRLEVVRRDQFLAMLSHELRNPLGAIVNAANANERSQSAESAANPWNVVRRQSQHMSRLLDDLLDVSRVTRNKIELQKEVIDLRRTCQDAIDVVGPLVRRREQALSLDLPDEPLFVDADAVRLQQLQVNLLANASKYTPDGGNIWLHVEQSGNDAIISVRDDGAGIRQEMLDSIFDLFVQSDVKTGRSDAGLGVGLTLVRSIVEKHGGRIDARSSGPGTGSEFIVRMPLTSRRPARLRPVAEVSRQSHCKILVVEDNHDARESLCTLLRLDGHEVVDAADGESALEAVSRSHPELALIDIGLPDIDGCEVARRIRADQEFDDVLLIALSGFGQGSDRKAAREAGFDDYIVKPLSIADLQNLLAERCPGAGN